MEQEDEEELTIRIAGRKALSEEGLLQIEMDYARGSYGDFEIRRLLQSAHIYRIALKHLFSYFHKDPDDPFYRTDAIRDRSLESLKSLVSMEDN